jgi:hypothetical protein
MTKFLEKGNFDLFSAMVHVHTDCDHLQTTLMFYIWAFMVNTISSPRLFTAFSWPFIPDG